MPVSPLSGPVGECIKKRLESAAFRFQEQALSWEDLSRYLLQDEKWVWDDEILLGCKQVIIDHFLECCKPYHDDDDSIDNLAMALQDGQQSRGYMKQDEGDDLVNEDSDNGTIKQPESRKVAGPDRVIFLGRLGNKKCDGATVTYTDKEMSRISHSVVLDRWELGEETYPSVIGVGPTGRKALVIDLTWEQDDGNKSNTTSFEVVSDDAILFDAEFGLNMFAPTCRSTQAKGHSVTKSLSNVQASRDVRETTSRSQNGKSSSSSSHRRKTAPSTSKSSENPTKEEFVRRRVIADLKMLAEMEWEEQGQVVVDSDAEEDEEDEAFDSGKGKELSSPNTSVSSRKDIPVKRWKK